MKTTTREIAKDVSTAIGPLVAYELLFKLISGGLLAPFFVWLLYSLVAASGSPAVSNDSIAAFLFTPLGWGFLVAGLTLQFVVTLIESAGLLAMMAGGIKGRRVGAVQALIYMAKRSGRLLKLAGLQTVLLLASAAPFLAAAAAVYASYLSDHDINYYLALRPPEFTTALVSGLLLLIGLCAAWCALYVRLIFALPECVLENARPLQALKASFKLTKGRTGRIVTALILWAMAVAALGLVLGLLTNLLEAAFLRLAGDYLAALIVTCSALLGLNIVVAVLLSFLGVTTQAALITRLYEQAKSDAGQPFASRLDDGLPCRREAQPRWFTRKRCVMGLAMAYFILIVLAGYALLDQIDVRDKTLVTAHRGSSRQAPENTASAVRQAIEDGADFAEIDVQETADGMVVVLHDADLMRMAGVNKNIWDMPYEGLKQVDVGRRFSQQFAGERVPTLEQMIELARGRIRLNIELKFNGHDQQLVERVVEIVRKNQFQQQCVLSSLDYEALGQVQRLDSGLTTGMIAGVSIGDLARLDVDFLAVSTHQVTPALVQAIHASGKQVHVWTVNDRATMSSMINLGVDNILTDEPKLLVQLLAERAELSPAQRIILGFRAWLEQ